MKPNGTITMNHIVYLLLPILTSIFGFVGELAQLMWSIIQIACLSVAFVVRHKNEIR